MPWHAFQGDTPRFAERLPAKLAQTIAKVQSLAAHERAGTIGQSQVLSQQLGVRKVFLNER